MVTVSLRSMPRLFDLIKIGSLQLKNRIVMPPMATGLATTRGEVTEDLIKHYEKRARGLGLQIVEHSYVLKGGKLSPHQLGIHEDKLAAGLAKLAERIHSLGTPITIQINHAGRVTASDVCGQQPVGPSPIPHSSKHEVPREISRNEIEEMIEAFSSAARRAVEAGFDAVEVHGAHGFLLNQFLSPLSNKRKDEYGGSLENRMRFHSQIIARIKENIGKSFPLLYRLGADDMHPEGLTLQESKVFAQNLEKWGVHAIDVSGGIMGSRPAHLTGPGYYVPLAEAIKSVVNVPVIGVGGIKTPEFADEVIGKNRADLVAVGRAMLADPKWALKAMEGLRSSN
ncbi:MAG: NADH:flavin oxidoreductase [Candidatus Bathyarchaeota archaeon]|nr:NADH:flavin oxidoreductase [Candidatus Bathyarchaeota archaeon]